MRGFCLGAIKGRGGVEVRVLITLTHEKGQDLSSSGTNPGTLLSSRTKLPSGVSATYLMSFVPRRSRKLGVIPKHQTHPLASFPGARNTQTQHLSSALTQSGRAAAHVLTPAGPGPGPARGHFDADTPRYPSR